VTSATIALKATDLGDGIVSRRDGLEITVEMPFNEWKRLGERLLDTQDRALWSLGDWRVYGERYGKDYHAALEKLDALSRFIPACARVSRAFDPERRRGQLSFESHELVAGLPQLEQESWLDDAERQGWDPRQLKFAFAESMPRVPAQALSVRLVEAHYRIAIAAAERRNMDPKEWVLEAIREKRDREAPELEAA
jgi:hypothetical protein